MLGLGFGNFCTRIASSVLLFILPGSELTSETTDTLTTESADPITTE